MDDDRYTATYRFGPLERRGIVGSWRAGQVLVIGVACVIGVLIFRSAPSSAGFVIGAALIGAGAAMTLVPIAGRTLDQWAPMLSDWLAFRASGRDVYRSDDPFRSESSGALPDALASCRIVSVPLIDGGELGVVHDRDLGAYTAVVAVQMRALGLLAAADQQRRLATWGRILSSLASERSALRRVQLLERTIPCEPDELLAHLAEHGTDAQPRARLSYEALLDSAAHVAQDHELLIAVQVDERRAWRAAGADATTRALSRQQQACVVLNRELRRMADRLESADITLLGVLDAEQLGKAVRLGYDPYRGRALPVGAVGPTAADTAWSTYRADSAVHRTYWVAEWPRTDVGPAFFTPLMLGLRAVRAVSVIFEPVPPGRSRAAVEAAITSDEADEQVRAERGFRLTARRRRQTEAARRREQELAEGHEEMRFTAFITVSGRDEDELNDACAELEDAAQHAFLVIEPLWGQQDVGLTFSALPLARGLKAARPWSVSA